MLHLAGRIAFGVDVGNFLQLQRAFESDGIVNASAEIEEIRVAEKLASELLDGGIPLQDCADFMRHFRQLLHQEF